MTNRDKERVVVFKRIIQEQKLFYLKNLNDSELLTLLNSTVLPNSMSFENLKYTTLFLMLLSKSKSERNSIQKILEENKELFEILSSSERDLLKFGLFYGFDSFDWRSQMNKYINVSSNPVVGDLRMPKKISSYFFSKIFNFVYLLIKKGEKNERFPRV